MTQFIEFPILIAMIPIDDFKNIAPPKKTDVKINATDNIVPQNTNNDIIDIDIFRRVNLRIAKIESAEPVLGSEKLLKLKISLGDERRQILAGIGKAYAPQELIGREVVIVANLEPRKLMGEESQGMLLAANNADGLPIILTPEKEVPAGNQVK